MSVYARLRLASLGAQTVHAGEIIFISDRPNSRGVFDIQERGQPILIRTGAQFRRARDVQHVTVVYRGAGHIDMPFSSSTPARALAPLYFDGDAVSADTIGTPIGYALHGCNSDRIHMEIIWDPKETISEIVQELDNPEKEAVSENEREQETPRSRLPKSRTESRSRNPRNTQIGEVASARPATQDKEEEFFDAQSKVESPLP